MNHVTKSFLIKAFLASTTIAASTLAKAEPIEDNSFLMEEAYNQDAGIVQFIQTFQRDKSGEAFYSFTAEIPVPNKTHQFSFTIPYSRLQSESSYLNGVGDVQLNYRYQWIANEYVLLAPRFTVLAPSGDDKTGFGVGSTGYQTNWAITVLPSPEWAVHMNFGATFYPKITKSLPKATDLYGQNSALSVIWRLHEKFNFLTEFVQTSLQEAVGSEVETTTSVLINPGFRFAVDFEKSQLVLGASMPTPVLYSQGPASYFAYVSYEPTLW